MRIFRRTTRIEFGQAAIPFHPDILAMYSSQRGNVSKLMRSRYLLKIDRRDTRFMRREKCAGKRLVGAFETGSVVMTSRNTPSNQRFFGCVPIVFVPSGDATEALLKAGHYLLIARIDCE